MKKAINISNAPKPIAPYSQAVLAGNTLYVSGQIPINPFNGELVKDDIKKQTEQVLENIRVILKEAKMDFTNIVKASIFISDMKFFAQVNEVYKGYFTNDPPARECIQAAKLPMNADVEISVIAVK